jgi:hypothetical protein
MIAFRSAGLARPLRAAATALVIVPAIVAAGPTRARADDTIPADRKVAIGVKLGFIPPIFTVAELVVRPGPHLALGIFGIVTPPVGIGDGGTRTSVGGELIYEFNEGLRGTPYLSFAYGYYHAARDANGFYETSHTVYPTAGYNWKFRHVEFYCGGGLLFLLVDETPPCTGICLNSDPPPVLPTTELGLRFGFP